MNDSKALAALIIIGSIGLGGYAISSTLGVTGMADGLMDDISVAVNDTLDRIEPVFSDPNGLRPEYLVPQSAPQYRRPVTSFEATQEELDMVNDASHRGVCEYWSNNGTLADKANWEREMGVDCARWGF